MPLFKTIKPFISIRIYMCVDKDDIKTKEKYNLQWDKEYETWYLDACEYDKSPISNNPAIKDMLQPFKVFGQHQYFL